MRARNRNSRSHPRAVLAALVGVVLAIGVDLASCGETAGQEISFATAIAGGVSQGTVQEFTTYAGWKVKLEKALAAVGPLYFYEGEPQASWMQRLLGANLARACPTHAQYNKGTVLGEVLEQYVVDLLKGAPTSTGDVFGLAGTCRTVELHLHPPGEVSPGSPAGDFAALGGHTIYLAGSAEKGGTTIRFADGITIPDEGLLQIVESIAAEVKLESGAQGTLLLEALLDQWLASVDFSTLTAQGGDHRFTAGTQAHSALLRGVRARGAYRAAWRRP